MDKLTSNDRKRFNEDGFLIVDKLIKPATVSVLHQAFTDLFDGKFETGVRPDEVNWQTESGDTSLTWHGSGENSGELPRRSLYCMLCAAMSNTNRRISVRA